VDRWIGRVAAQLSPQDTLAIVSDHGFRWFEDRPLVSADAHTATAEQWHRKEAVFIVAGPTVRRGGTRHTMTLLDVSASLFVLAGLPVGEGMPGVAPGWVVAGQDRAVGKVDYSALVSLEELHERSRRAEVSPEVKAEQMAKLRALGYIGDEPDEAGAESGPNYDRFEARRLHNLATRLMDAGDLEEAERNYREAVAADPTYGPPHYAFAFLLRKTGRYDEADRHFWQAVDL
ncbi:MAG: tetratricopeptide repeat protein, partial [Phycisphaeraceae bacterium]|nr:tetratricopeptide repeat protein [Phycisphaeraceae bacterium]